MVVHVREEAHDELAVHAVRHATVAGDGMTEILNLERPLQARGKEASEGGDERREGGKHNRVDLYGRQGNAEVRVIGGEEEEVWQVVGVWEKDGIGVALQSREDVGTEILAWSVSLQASNTAQVRAYIDRADEILALHERVGEEDPEQDRYDPGADEALDGFLGRELDELGPPERDATYIGEYVVGDDERGREEKPDHALEDVVHDEVGLDHNKIERHVRPRELGELELVVSSLERSHKEDETCRRVSRNS